jgi:hypothetical protein
MMYKPLEQGGLHGGFPFHPRRIRLLGVPQRERSDETAQQQPRDLRLSA